MGLSPTVRDTSASVVSVLSAEGGIVSQDNSKVFAQFLSKQRNLLAPRYWKLAPRYVRLLLISNVDVFCIF